MKNKSIITNFHRVPGWRILRRGERVRATDLQFTGNMPMQLTEACLVRCNVTGEFWVGTILGIGVWEDYNRTQSQNLFYRKVGAK